MFFLSMIDCIEPTFFIRWSPGQASFQLYHFSRQARQAAINQLSKNILKAVFLPGRRGKGKKFNKQTSTLMIPIYTLSLSLSLTPTHAHTHAHFAIHSFLLAHSHSAAHTSAHKTCCHVERKRAKNRGSKIAWLSHKPRIAAQRKSC